MATRSRIIKATEWDNVKSLILEMRRAGVPIKGHRGIAVRMEEEHGFIARPGQYELILCKWSDRRNLSKAEWRTVLQFISRHEDANMECDMRMNGELVPPDKLRRQRRRYGSLSDEVVPLTVLLNSLPECVEFTTYSQNGSYCVNRNTDVAIVDNLLNHLGSDGNTDPDPDLATLALGSEELAAYENVPLQEINHIAYNQAGFEGSQAIPIARDLELNAIQPTITGPDGPLVTMQVDSTERSAPTQGNVIHYDNWQGNSFGMSILNESCVVELLPHIDQNLSSSVCNLGNYSGAHQTEAFTARSPSSVQPFLLPQSLHSTTPQNAMASTIQSSIELHISGVQLLQPSLGSLFYKNMGLMSRSISNLDVSFSSHSLARRNSANITAFASGLIRLLVRSIENNFLGLEGDSVEMMLNLLTQNDLLLPQFRGYLQLISDVSARDLVLKLSKVAIEKGNAVLFKELINRRVVAPEDLVYPSYKGHSTALELCIEYGSLPIASILIEAGVDPNGKMDPNWIEGSDPLGDAIERARFNGNWSFVHLLLEARATVRRTHMTFFNLCAPSEDLAGLAALAINIPPKEHRYFFNPEDSEGDGFFMVTRYLDDETATKICRHHIDVCRKTCRRSCLSSRPGQLIETMLGAHDSGQHKLEALLVESVDDKDILLMYSVKCSKTEQVRLLLQDGAKWDLSYDLRDSHTETTPLTEAIRMRNQDMVAEFEQHGAIADSLNTKNGLHKLISVMAEIGDLSNVEKVLSLELLSAEIEKDADIMADCFRVAAENGHEAIALLMVEAGATLERTQYDFLFLAICLRSKVLVETILECEPELRLGRRHASGALRWGDRSIINSLIFANVTRSRSVLTDFLWAAGGLESREDFTFLFAYYGLDASYITGSVLEEVIRSKKTEMLCFLLDSHAEIDYEQALWSAVRYGDKNKVERILQAAARNLLPGKSNFGGDSLNLAVERRRYDLVEMLLDAGCGAKEDVRTLPQVSRDPPAPPYSEFSEFNALGAAIYLGDVSRVRTRIELGCDLEAVTHVLDDSLGYETALIQAISTRNVSVVEFLLSEGANPHRPAGRGFRRTALQQACEDGSQEIVDLLLAHGAKTDEPPAYNGGATCLQLTSIRGDLTLASQLLGLGANVHAAPAPRNGRTALQGAAEHGRLDMITLLWDAADGQNFAWKEVDRAIKLAEKNRHLACAEVLRELLAAQMRLLEYMPTDTQVDEEMLQA